MHEESDGQSKLGDRKNLEDRLQELKIDRNEASVLIFEIGQRFEDVLHALAVLHQYQRKSVNMGLNSIL